MDDFREFDTSSPHERVIMSAVGAGTVLWSRDIEWSGIIERQIVALVDGRYGPDLACARAWPGATGRMINIVDSKVSFDEAFRINAIPNAMSHSHWPWLQGLDTRDAAVARVIGGSAKTLWRAARPESAAYLLALDPRQNDGAELAVLTATRRPLSVVSNVELALRSSDLECLNEPEAMPGMAM